MKYYLADFDIRDGDNEYKLQFLVQAENLADAENKAIDGLCYNFGVDQNEWDEKGEELDLFSRIISRGNLPQEIPDHEATILKKYFWVATELLPALPAGRQVRVANNWPLKRGMQCTLQTYG
jgi:hypothetical protein